MALLALAAVTIGLLARSHSQQAPVQQHARVYYSGAPQTQQEVDRAMDMLAALPGPTTAEIHATLSSSFYPNAQNVEHVWWNTNMLMVPFSDPKYGVHSSKFRFL